MLRSFSVELLKMCKRPANWVLMAVVIVLSQVFNYLVPYAGYLGAENDREAQTILVSAMPENLVPNSIGGFPIFAGALALTLGAIAVGGEYGWGTLKTVLVQRPRRLSVYAGQLLALAVGVFAIVAAVFALGAVTSYVIASSQSEAVDWPSAADLFTGAFSGWLILMVWCLLGVTLAFSLRAMALPIGLGIVWILGIENMIVNVAAPLWEFAESLQQWLPGVNAGSLVAALNGGEAGGTPGVNTAVDGTQATLTLITYAVVFALIAAIVLHRRDVT